MKLQIALVDDLAVDRRQLRLMLEKWFMACRKNTEVSFSEFETAQEFLLRGGYSGKFEIAFLDICMEGQNGLEAAALLRKAHTDTKIVFVTSAPEYALDAFSVHPFDFLVKPFEEKKIDKVMRDLQQEFVEVEKTIEIRVPFGVVNVPVSQVISVVSRGHSVEFRMEKGNTVSSPSTFAEIQKLLEPYVNFLNINRGVLINMDKALFLEKGSIVMSDKASYPLRLRDQNSLIRTFTQYQIRHRMKGM